MCAIYSALVRRCYLPYRLDGEMRGAVYAVDRIIAGLYALEPRV